MTTRDVYLSNNNIDFLYRDVCDQVSRKYNYDLNTSPKYKKSFPTMMDKVYQNCDTNITNNLTSLNRLTVQKISSYFFDQLSNKKQNNLMERPTKSTNMSENDMNSRLEELRTQRNGRTDRNDNQVPTLLNPISVQELESKGETNKKYKQLLADRGEALPQPAQPPSQHAQVPQQNKAVYQDLKPVIPPQSVSSRNEEFNILPFSLSDDFSNQASNPGQPLYINSDQLLDVSGENVKHKYDDIQKMRNSEINEFLTYQQATKNNVFAQNPQEIREGMQNTNLVVSDYLGERTGVDHINAVRNPGNINKAEMYHSLFGENQKEKEKKYTDADLQQIINPNNAIYDFLLSQIKSSQREYHDVPYYFVVSSEDRQWENNAENRYNFMVNFRPNGSQKGAGIDTLYKNIVSVEVVKVIFPHDRLGVPFDNRVYLDLQSYPFLIMDIDELDWVFKGSNNIINDAFALLLFDKAYDSEVLTQDQIHHSVVPQNGIYKKFDRQFKRGFMSFCPFLFEKKKYPNAPLASLNRMTIRFFRPDGQVISLDQDHLEIQSIELEDLADHELTKTTGFPGTTLGKYVKITTKSFFSNRTFRIGDLIKIKNYTLNSSVSNSGKFKFAEFINRSQGHIIINLEAENSDDTASNEGYINVIYISPPGEVDFKTGTLDATTFNDNVPDVEDDVSNPGVLINSSMQVHITFKIVTREDKTASVINPINV
jgi:hypothetical protein